MKTESADVSGPPCQGVPEYVETYVTNTSDDGSSTTNVTWAKNAQGNTFSAVPVVATSSRTR